MSDGASGRTIFTPVSGIILLIASTLFTLLRLIARHTQRTGKIDLGDLFLGLGWVCATAITVMSIHAAWKEEIFIHVRHVAEGEKWVTAAFYIVMLEVLYYFSLSCIKLAIFYHYHTLTANLGYRRLLLIVRGFLALQGAYLITYAILPFLACRPFKAWWKQWDPAWTEPWTCIDYMGARMTSEIFQSITDIVACLIPLVLVYLQKTCNAKFGLSLVLFFGFLATASGITKTVEVEEWMHDPDEDWTWFRAKINNISMHHVHLAIIWACAPFAYQLLQPFFEKLFLRLRFNRGNNLHATRAVNVQPSYFSLRSKSPSSDKSIFPSLRDSITVAKLTRKLGRAYDIEEGLEEIRPAKEDKKAGKRKVTPPALDLERPATARSEYSASQFEITVVYTPPVPQTHVPEMQSPTLPPDSLIRSHRLSNMSWITGRSMQSRWSSVRSSSTTSSTTLAPHRKSRRGVIQHSTNPQSPVSPISMTHPLPSPGLSTIDLGELPDIHALPEMPPLPKARILCSGCGRFHPAGYRHTDAEVNAKLSRFQLFRSSSTRDSQSTFYDDRDDGEDVDFPVSGERRATRVLER